MNDYRVAIVGAGPAGLAAALTLARSMQATIVFDATSPTRNAASPGIGSLVGREKMEPADLKSAALEEIERYGQVRFVDQAVQQINTLAEDGFELAAEDGTIATAARVLLACGMVDVLPAWDGLSSFWGTSVINCPFCHGFELRDRPWGIVVNRQEMVDIVEVYRTWTGDLVLFLESGIELSAEREAELVAKGFGIERRAIRRLHGDGNHMQRIELEDGATIARDALVLWPQQHQTDLVASLGLEFNGDGSVVVDDGYRTGLDGLYAAGDLLYAGHQNVNTALHMGNLAAATMVLDLSMTGTNER